MCGRFTLTSSEEQIAAILPGLIFDAPVTARYNIAPTQSILAVLNEAPRRATPVHWGLIPSWAKDPAIGNRMINARAETVHEKPAYKRPFQRQRCLILADGFYEWRKNPADKKKTPVYAHLHNHRPFAFAGLWDRWRSSEGEPITSATIITTTPNDLMADIHDRMPAILPAEAYGLWLSADAPPTEDLRALLSPYPAEDMAAYAVSTRVNRPTTDDPGCIEPAPAS